MVNHALEWPLSLLISSRARDVADRWPEAMVVGMDLYPPSMEWVPPNCRLQVDDMLKKWEFSENGKWDLIHISPCSYHLNLPGRKLMLTRRYAGFFHGRAMEIGM